MHRLTYRLQFAAVLFCAFALGACDEDEASADHQDSPDAAVGIVEGTNDAATFALDASTAATAADPALLPAPRTDVEAGAAPLASLDAGGDAVTIPDALAEAGASSAPGIVINGAEIETVTVEAREISAGVITLKEPYPVLLLRDGTACLDMNFVVQPDDVASHRAKNPGKWLSWKRESGRIALRRGESWFFVHFGGEYPPKPRGATLEGRYTYSSSYILGQVVRVTERSYGFSKEGRFAVGAQSLFSTSNVADGSFPENQRGTYEIQGYEIRFQYDSGERAVASFVDGGKTIYIAGTWYGAQGN